MTDLIYREDAYAQQISAKVLAASAEAIVTDRTNFYAQAGGQPGDTGLLRWAGGEARITNTITFPEAECHSRNAIPFILILLFSILRQNTVINTIQ